MANLRGNHPIYRNGAGNQRQSSSIEYEDEGEVDYQNMTAQQFEERKKDQLTNQDALLDQIHNGVKGLKTHANAINNEVTEQNVMIDDLGDRMDHAQNDLEREELVAREVNKQKKKSCKLYGIVAILIAILITLFVV